LAGPFLFVDRGFRAEHFANEHWMRGYFWVRSPQDRQNFYLAGKNVIGELWIDGTEAVRLEPPSNEAVASAPWPSGMRRLTIRVSGGSAQRVEAGRSEERRVGNECRCQGGQYVGPKSD